MQGNVAMFDHLQHQLHFNDDGMFMTGRTDKKMKFQLGDPPQDDLRATEREKLVRRHRADSGSSSSSSSGGQSGGRKLTGQKKRYDKDSKQYYQMTKDATKFSSMTRPSNTRPSLHSFQPSSGATARDGNPLVQIFGDKVYGTAWATS